MKKIAKIEGGKIAWLGNIELAPDAMYDSIKSDGIWVLRKEISLSIDSFLSNEYAGWRQ